MGLCRMRQGLAIVVLFLSGLLAASSIKAQGAQAPSIGQQMQALWQGEAHFQEVRRIEWWAAPYSTVREGAGWFAKPMPFADGKWYLFDHVTRLDKPSYCPGKTGDVVVRESSDEGRTWSNPAIVAAGPGPETAPDACGVVDGTTFYDGQTDTWHMLAQCRAAQNAGGWMMCHYARRGSSPMGPFNPDPAPAVRAGQLFSQICAHSGGICDPGKTVDEGTPDIVYKKDGYFYVTFHGVYFSKKPGSRLVKQAVRGVAKTADFHHWITSGADLPDAPIFAWPECQAWNPGCIGGGEASTLIAGGYQYMMIETPNVSTDCTPGQQWPIALLRTPQGSFPAWNSPLWQRFHIEPLLATSWPGPQSKCGIQYPRWAVAGDHVYILYEDIGFDDTTGRQKASARRLLELVPGGGPATAVNPD